MERNRCYEFVSFKNFKPQSFKFTHMVVAPILFCAFMSCVVLNWLCVEFTIICLQGLIIVLVFVILLTLHGWLIGTLYFDNVLTIPRHSCRKADLECLFLNALGQRSFNINVWIHYKKVALLRWNIFVAKAWDFLANGICEEIFRCQLNFLSYTASLKVLARKK